MAAIKFTEQHEARGWSFILRHADDAYFRKDGVVFVAPTVLRKLQRAHIPYQVMNSEVAVGKNEKKTALRSKKRS